MHCIAWYALEAMKSRVSIERHDIGRYAIGGYARGQQGV